MIALTLLIALFVQSGGHILPSAKITREQQQVLWSKVIAGNSEAISPDTPPEEALPLIEEAQRARDAYLLVKESLHLSEAAHFNAKANRFQSPETRIGYGDIVQLEADALLRLKALNAVIKTLATATDPQSLAESAFLKVERKALESLLRHLCNSRKLDADSSAGATEANQAVSALVQHYTNLADLHRELAGNARTERHRWCVYHEQRKAAFGEPNQEGKCSPPAP